MFCCSKFIEKQSGPFLRLLKTNEEEVEPELEERRVLFIRCR